MKKFLVCLIAISILAAAGIAGLSVLPHTHGEDHDHSQHKSCAVYQLSLAGPLAVKEAAAFIFTSFVLFRLAALAAPVPSTRYFHFTSPRAPPATS